MDLDLGADMSAEMGARVSPTLIAVNQILSLSSMELQKAIKQEAEDNPAFEIMEHQTCPICGEQLRGNACANCAQRAANDATILGADGVSMDDYTSADYIVGGGYSAMADDEEFDPMTLVAAERTLATGEAGGR